MGCEGTWRGHLHRCSEQRQQQMAEGGLAEEDWEKKAPPNWLWSLASCVLIAPENMALSYGTGSHCLLEVTSHIQCRQRHHYLSTSSGSEAFSHLPSISSSFPLQSPLLEILRSLQQQVNVASGEAFSYLCTQPVHPAFIFIAVCFYSAGKHLLSAWARNLQREERIIIGREGRFEEKGKLEPGTAVSVPMCHRFEISRLWDSAIDYLVAIWLYIQTDF